MQFLSGLLTVLFGTVRRGTDVPRQRNRKFFVTTTDAWENAGGSLKVFCSKALKHTLLPHLLINKISKMHSKIAMHTQTHNT